MVVSLFVFSLGTSVIAIAGLLSNIVVISCFLRFSQLRTVTNKYILNLSVACLGSSISIALDSIHGIFNDYEWQGSETLCKYCTFSVILFRYANGCIVVIICLDRYLEIVGPTSRTRVVSNVVMTEAWVASALLAIPTFIYCREGGEYCNTSWPEKDDYRGIDVVEVYVIYMCFAVPINLIVIFNILVAQRLNIFGNFNRPSEIAVKCNRSAVDNDDVKGSTSVVDESLVIVAAIWTFCTITIAVCDLLTIIQPHFWSNSNFFAYILILLLLVCLSFGELSLPFLFVFLNDNYRTCVRMLFTCPAVGNVDASQAEERSDSGQGEDMTKLHHSNSLPHLANTVSLPSSGPVDVFKIARYGVCTGAQHQVGAKVSSGHRASLVSVLATLGTRYMPSTVTTVLLPAPYSPGTTCPLAYLPLQHGPSTVYCDWLILNWRANVYAENAPKTLRNALTVSLP